MITRFNLSVSMGAFIVTQQANKQVHSFLDLPIALKNYCFKASKLN